MDIAKQRVTAKSGGKHPECTSLYEQIQVVMDGVGWCDRRVACMLLGTKHGMALAGVYHKVTNRIAGIIQSLNGASWLRSVGKVMANLWIHSSGNLDCKPKSYSERFASVSHTSPFKMPNSPV